MKIPWIEEIFHKIWVFLPFVAEKQFLAIFYPKNNVNLGKKNSHKIFSLGKENSKIPILYTRVKGIAKFFHT